MLVGKQVMTTEEIATSRWFILIITLSFVSGKRSDDFRGDLDHPLVHPDHNIIFSGQTSDDYREDLDHPLVHSDHNTIASEQTSDDC